MKHDGGVSMDTTSRAGRSLLCIWILLVIGSCAELEEENPRIVEHPADHYVAKNEPAKLHCKAEGDPTPEITWYRNGQKVITNKDDQNAHRLLLNGGNQLFFLRIIHTKNLKPDVGTYYCNATNIHGSAISRNATLQIAVLRDDFRESPQSATAAAGELAIFHCKPPRGEPEPKVLWHKDGTPITPDNRVIVSSEGDLTISSVKVTDAGKYTCLAINQGGEKESGPATLTVLEKPTFREMPDDIQANVDDTVELKCRASGTPTQVFNGGKKRGGFRSEARQLDDGTLRIEKVQVVDDGVYVCVAENSAGTVEAVGRLSVQTLPSFVITPRDMSVGRGRTAIFQCVVTSNPPPTVFWSKGKEQLLMFPHQDHGRFLVSEDGTLRIKNVEYRDEGTFVCQALNSLSNSKVTTASAVLSVRDQDDRPPPTIMVGPQNQTVEPKEVALLTCQVDGEPPPTVRWYKDAKPLVNSDPRIAILNSGTLQISDVKVTDSGSYTCKAISETGETDWTASLTVSKQGPYLRTQKPSAFPGTPSKPKVSDIADTSVHLTWAASDQIGQSHVFAFVVEYFSPQTSEGWQVATDSVSRESYTVKDLQPDTKYMFFVRAKNSFGLSPPSPHSDYITTREKRLSFAVNMPREEIIKELSVLNIELKAGESINATSVRVKWEVGTSLAAIEGYIVNYTHIIDLDPLSYGVSQTVRITDPYQFKTYIINLNPFSWYEVCVQAYARDISSRCSNSIKVPTKESVPSAPPENILIHKEGNSLHIRWSPPPRPQQNGDIKGYDIYCVAEDDNNNNCSTTAGGRESSAVIKNVDAEGSYKIRIAARTNKGRGVWSKDFIMGPEQSDITSEPWFVWMLVGTIGGTLWLALCVFSIWLCRRRRRSKKKKMAQNGMYSAVPVHKSEESARAGSVMTREDVIYAQKEGTIHGPYGGLQSDLASLLECGHKDGADSSQVYSAATTMPQMKTFYQRPGPPSSVAPYATTTLISKGGNTASRPGQNSGVDSGFRPINHAYVHSSASGSGDSCQKPDMRSSDSNTDNSRPNTGHYSYAAGCPHEHCEGMTSPGSDSGSLTTDENGMPIKRNKYSKIGGCSSCGQGKQPMVNWAELLPPPPEHPPPSELGSPMDHSVDSSIRLNSNIAETRFMDNCRPISPVSKISACSCPAPHDRMVPHLRPNIPYSDIEYPTHPGPSHRYHAEMGGNYQDGGGGGGSGSSNYNSDRPYSPKPMNSTRSQTTDTLLHRCPSPRSCHNCGSSIQQSSGHQLPQSSSSSSSSYNPHVHHHHHPLHSDSFVTVNQRQPCIGDMNDSRIGLYPQAGAVYPQGNVCASFTQPGGGQCPYNPMYPYPPTALHGYRIPPMEANEQRNANDLEQYQVRLYPPGHDGPHMDRACQSSLPSLANESIQAGYGRRADSPVSEGGPDYAGESDMDVHRATDCHTPDSSVNGDGSLSGSMKTGWPSQTDTDEISNDESDCQYDNHHHFQHQHDDHDDDISSSSDSSFLADTDFASAVARAAELSGLTVVGTTVTDPKNSSNKKYRKHKSTVRPQSPYSTDSNMSAVVHKPYPKSERKKQLMEQARKYGQRKDGDMQDLEIVEAAPPFTEMDLPDYHRPYYPSVPFHNDCGTFRSPSIGGGYRVPMMQSEQRENSCSNPSHPFSQPLTPVSNRLPTSASTFGSADIPVV